MQFQSMNYSRSMWVSRGSGSEVGELKLMTDVGDVPGVMFRWDGSIWRPFSVSKQVKYLTADQINLGSAFTDITGLAFAVRAGIKYEFEYVLRATADATTTGIDVSVNGPAAPAFLSLIQVVYTSTGPLIYHDSIYDHAPGGGQANSGTNKPYIARGVFIPSADGTLVPRVKREAVGSGPDVLTNSYGTLGMF